jgi:tRNA (guanine-N7-)-methyltransferase
MTSNRITLTREELLWGVAELPRPFDPNEWFGRTTPLELELGSGTGAFIAEAAARRPEHNFIGVEISLKYARIAAYKLERDGIPNARMLHADSRDVLRNILPPASVTACHIYYADPWFKKRHLKRRVIDEEFTSDLARVLRPGARLFIKTDITAYYEQIVESFAACPKFRSVDDRNLRDAPLPDNITTNFERKALEAGHLLHYLEFTSNPKE